VLIASGRSSMKQLNHISPIKERTQLETETVYSKLNDVFHDVFDDDQIILNPQLSANDVEGWDSLRHIRLLLTVERTFKIKFSVSEIGRLKNVGDLATLIQSKA
jgi:acyl carrier protein